MEASSISSSYTKQWQKAETDSGMVYYVNHATQKTAWNHPKYIVAMEMIEECNNIKYAAYRTAAKLNILQKTLSLDHVELSTVAGVFHRHHIQVTENGLALERSELESIISDIFFAASKETTRHHFQVDLCTELTLHFLLSVYDSEDRRRVCALSAKVALACLCSARLQDKYQYLFGQLADHNNCLSRRKLRAMLLALTALTDHLSESLAFSPDLIPATVDSCFQQCDGPLGISEDVFMAWLMKEPQLLVWLSTLYRLKAAEKVSHGVRCAVCRTYPIVGLRYRCLRCLNYDQCQHCFFHGHLSKRHKLKHPMQEYCWETTPGQATVAFFKAFVNRLCGNSSRLQYLPVQPVGSSTDFQDIWQKLQQPPGKDFYGCLASGRGDSSEESTLVSCTDSSSLSSTLAPRLNPRTELQSIISQLERQLEEFFESSSGEDLPAKLQQHRLFLESQIHRLKQLKHHMDVPVGRMQSQSTPLATGPDTLRHEFTGLSPIYTHPPVFRDSTRLTHRLGETEPITPREPSRFSQWLEASRPPPTTTPPTPVTDMHSDLDNILDKLQLMLASNFSLADSKSREVLQNGISTNGN